MKKKSNNKKVYLSKTTLQNLSESGINGMNYWQQRAVAGGTLAISVVNGGCTRPTKTCASCDDPVKTKEG